MTEKISRNIAFRNYQTRYFTGIPCKNGHIADKLTSNGKCVECNKIKLKLKRMKLKELRMASNLKQSLKNIKSSLEAHHQLKLFDDEC